MSYGSFTVECKRDFTAAELAEAVADVEPNLELHFVDAISRAQGGRSFVDEATKDRWTHLTFWEKTTTGTALIVERATRGVPFRAVFRTEVAAEFDDTPERRAAIGELARRVVDRACGKLDMTLVGVEPAA